MGRVLVSGAWVPISEARVLLNHPGHADQSSHGRKGGGGLDVRESLASAGTARQVADVAVAEARRITGGRYISFDFTGSHPTTAAEHAEGILRGLERFPRANLQRVQTVQSSDTEYAHAQGDTIRFNSAYASRAGRQKYLDSLAEGVAGWDRGLQTYGISDQKIAGFHTRNSGSPVAVALHEFGHVVDISTTRERSSAAVHQLTLDLTRSERRKQTLPGTPVRDNGDYVQRTVSSYARTNSKELVAEAFTDVMVNGSSASRLSSGIFDALESSYDASHGS